MPCSRCCATCCSCYQITRRRTVHPFKGQVYARLKKECISEKKLFVDRTFPPSNKSAFYSRDPPCEILWKRPGDIVDNPHFVFEGIDRDDLTQGALGNCWFVAACACIAQDRSLLCKVVPDLEEQEWRPKKPYAGIFHFQFWWTGQWVDVVIDDFLPTRKNRLLYVHSKESKEFWSALLEKAYAKLFGSYESLIAGKTRDALVNMTGGVAEGMTMEEITTDEKRTKLFNELVEFYENGSLMAASIVVANAQEMEAKLDCGLVKGHAYSITNVKNLNVGTGLFSYFKRDFVPLIRLRNPWGGVEWNGAWSDGAPEWTKVTVKRRKSLGLEIADNGEFWMNFEDFAKFYTHIDICYLFNTSLFSMKILRPGALSQMWNGRRSIQVWRKPHRAGGCLNHESFLFNPQYLLTVLEKETKFIFSLEQDDRRAVQKPGTKNLIVGVTITETDLNRKYRMHVQGNRVHAGPFVQARSTCTRVSLQPGKYLLVPSTFEPNLQSQFVLRAFSKNKFIFKELIHDEPAPPLCCGPCVHPVRSVVAVTVVKADELGNEDQENYMNTYCIIKCEGEIHTSHTVEKDIKPKWNVRVTFYRKDTHSDIYVEVWNEKKLQIDDFLGYVEIMLDQHHEEDEVIRYPLSKTSLKGMKVKAQGFVWLSVQHSVQLDEL